MNTTTPNSPFGQPQAANSGNNRRKSNDNFGQQAAAAGIGAVAGTAAGWAANEAFDEPDVIVETPDIEVEEVTEQPQPSAPAASQHTAPAPSTNSQSAAQTISNQNEGQHTTANTANNNGGGHATTGQQNSTGQHEEPVNPNDIEIDAEDIDISVNEETDDIIAEEYVDPNDINMGDKLMFDSVGTVYTLDGDAYTAATFHFEGEEDQFVMVDIDGDEVFDIITDENFTVEIENPYGLTAGDAEQQLSAEDPSYLTASVTEPELPEDVDFTDDIILT